MSLKREIEIFDNVRISSETGETDVWDRVIFPGVIRAREIRMFLDLTRKLEPKSILDFGCGTGWVSKELASNGYNVTGIDTSSSLIRSAVQTDSVKSQFLVGDCMNLPFQDNSFDLVIGIAILHHLDLEQGLQECYRILTPKGTLLLMEPNKYNPIAAVARIVMPVDTQTPDEEPFTPGIIRKAFAPKLWSNTKTGYLFPYSFGLSQILKKTRADHAFIKFICPFIRMSEKLYEKLPFLNRLCWVITVVSHKNSIAEK